MYRRTSENETFFKSPNIFVFGIPDVMYKARHWINVGSKYKTFQKYELFFQTVKPTNILVYYTDFNQRNSCKFTESNLRILPLYDRECSRLSHITFPHQNTNKKWCKAPHFYDSFRNELACCACKHILDMYYVNEAYILRRIAICIQKWVRRFLQMKRYRVHQQYKPGSDEYKRAKARFESLRGDPNHPKCVIL
jgi:hypothetical protein